MLEPINNSTPNIKSYNSQNSLERVRNFKAARLSSNIETESPEESNSSVTGMPSQSTPEQPKEDLTGLHLTDIQFSIHEETGKTMIKIIDEENHEIIREIPSRENLERSARLQAYVGQLFDAMA